MIDVEGTQSIAEALAQNCGLKLLNISRNKLGDVGVTIICKGLTSNSSLQSLMLNGSFNMKCFLKPIENNIGPVGAEVIAQYLESNRTLKTLVLFGTTATVNIVMYQGNNIKDQGAASLARALAKNTRLTFLHVSRTFVN